MNAGDTGFMLICSALVFFMTPGLAFFYGGLVEIMQELLEISGGLACMELK